VDAFDVTCLGELLVDFSPQGGALYRANPGGAPANVAVCVQRLGGRAAFLGQVGDDPFGHMLRGVLLEEGVDVDGLHLSPDAPTALAFVHLSEDGERSFSFRRDGTADTRYAEEQVDAARIEASRVFHFGSLSLVDAPCRNATERALEIARRAGCLISFDPNLRASLWPSVHAAREIILRILDRVHLLKASAEEATFLSGLDEPENAARSLLEEHDLELAVVTMSGRGAVACARDSTLHAAALEVEDVRDTTGAGDAFVGGFLFGLIHAGSATRWTPDVVAEAMRWGVVTAGLSVANLGAIPSLPLRLEVERRLRAQMRAAELGPRG
jgi:fructokinase